MNTTKALRTFNNVVEDAGDYIDYTNSYFILWVDENNQPRRMQVYNPHLGATGHFYKHILQKNFLFLILRTGRWRNETPILPLVYRYCAEEKVFVRVEDREERKTAQDLLYSVDKEDW